MSACTGRGTRTGCLDEAVVQLPREERFGHLAEPELHDGGNVVDVCQVLFGQQVGALDIWSHSVTSAPDS